MPDWSEGKIYFIYCNITGDIYIGSTTQRLLNRINSHKRDNGTSQQIIQRGDWFYELIEDYPCDKREDLLWRERYWMDKSRNCFNVINVENPIRTQEEKDSYKKNWELQKYYQYTRNERRREIRDWIKSWGNYQGKTQLWDNNLLNIDLTLFQ
tara:strand:- start:58 stop:516 length:459 start_codon:yes stop_codon:yes gene_type:complete